MLGWVVVEVEFQGMQAFLEWEQAATVRGGTAVAGFFGGIVVGHCG